MNLMNKGNKEKALESLHVYINKCPSLVEKKLNKAVDLFGETPGGSKHHHAYRYGLLIHTAEVVRTAHIVGYAFQKVNHNIITVAAILHDLGKIHDYTIKREWVRSTDGPNHYVDVVSRVPGYDIGNHITFSAKWFNLNMRDVFSPAEADAIEHCILAHHNLKEWGSPVTPKTPEAWALHLADMASATAGVEL